MGIAWVACSPSRCFDNHSTSSPLSGTSGSRPLGRGEAVIWPSIINHRGQKPRKPRAHRREAIKHSPIKLNNALINSACRSARLKSTNGPTRFTSKLEFSASGFGSARRAVIRVRKRIFALRFFSPERSDAFFSLMRARWQNSRKSSSSPPHRAPPHSHIDPSTPSEARLCRDVRHRNHANCGDLERHNGFWKWRQFPDLGEKRVEHP